LEQIVVHKKNGNNIIRLYSYANNSGITRAEQVMELMGQDIVNITLVSAIIIDFHIGDYIEVFGKRYTINTPSEVYKRNDREFEYDIRFEGIQYELIKAQLLDVDINGDSTGTSFFFTGNLNDYVQMIIRNMERVHGQGKWVVGTVATGTDVANMQFDNITCMQALLNICEQYDQEYDIERIDTDSYRLNVRKNENKINQTFRYGRVKGLYTLRRQSVSNQNIITRLFAYGSEKNILANYRGGATRLKMPVSIIHSEGAPYIESVVYQAQYGVIEGTAIFDEIYPHRIGKVSALDPNDVQVFVDNSMGFDLNAQNNGNSLYLIPGLDAKITFKTGNLAGYEFTLSSYNNSQKRFRINTYTDERGQIFPSSPAFLIDIGDEYVITDINLPQSYIDTAENELYQRAIQYLIENAKPKVQYELELDEFFIKRLSEDVIEYLKSNVLISPNSPFFNFPLLSGITAQMAFQARVNNDIVNYFLPGDSIPVKDQDLNIDESIKITGITRDLLRHYRYKLTLGESKLKINTSLRKSIGNTKYTPAINAVNSGTLAISGSVGNNSSAIGGISNSLSLMKQSPSNQKTGVNKIEIIVDEFNSTIDENTGATILNDYRLKKNILLILRGNIPETNYVQDTSWNITFPDGISQGETLKILYTDFN